MRYIALALALCFTVAPISAVAASQTVKVKGKRSKVQTAEAKESKEAVAHARSLALVKALVENLHEVARSRRPPALRKCFVPALSPQITRHIGSFPRSIPVCM